MPLRVCAINADALLAKSKSMMYEIEDMTLWIVELAKCSRKVKKARTRSVAAKLVSHSVYYVAKAESISCVIS